MRIEGTSIWKRLIQLCGGRGRLGSNFGPMRREAGRKSYYPQERAFKSDNVAAAQRAAARLTADVGILEVPAPSRGERTVWGTLAPYHMPARAGIEWRLDTMKAANMVIDTVVWREAENNRKPWRPEYESCSSGSRNTSYRSHIDRA